MGLKFRRGTTAQKSGSLAFGEPYVNTDLGTLQIGGATGDITLGSSGTGSTGAFGAISGSGLDITGNANIAGNLTLGGAITIGDATADTVNVVASLSSSLIPQTTNAFDLGSATKIWRDLYISTGSIKFIGAGGSVASTLSINANGSQNFPNDLVVNGLTVGKGLNSITTNTAVGVSALSANTSGSSNTAIGSNALKVNTTGVANTAIGADALQANETTTANTAVGWGALRYNTGANGNTAVGSAALQMNTTGNGNTAVGNAALSANVTGVNNTALGTNVLGSGNGNNNIGVGTNALVGNISGSYNIGIGYTALEINTTGNGNIVIGDTAGNLITTGNYNTIIGKYAGTAALSNNIVLADGEGNIKYRYDGTNNNLYGNVNVSGSIIPEVTNTYDLGSPTKIWRDLYISQNSIKVVDGTGSIISTISTNANGSQNFTNGIIVTGSIVGSNGITGSIAATNGVVSGSSQIISILSSLNTTTASLETRMSTLATLTGSNAVKLTNLESTTASLNISVTNLNTATSSYETKGRSIVSGSAQIDGSLLGSNKTITVGSTAITLGGTATTIAGLTSVTSTGFTGALTGNASTVTNGVYTTDTGTVTNTMLAGSIADTKLSTISTAGKVSNSATTATSANTFSAIVARDVTGNFTATTITAALSGNASTATTLQTARNINGVSFNGSADITVTAAAGTLSGATLASGVTASSLTSVGTLTSLTVTGAITANGGIAVTGALTATGDITAYYSDGRLKENLQVIPNALEKVSKLTGYTYNTNALGKQLLNNENDNDIKVGVIAQDLQEVLPQAVKFAPFDRDAEGNSKSGENYLTVQYEKIVPLLIQAIKEQQTQIHSLTLEIEKLKEPKGL